MKSRRKVLFGVLILSAASAWVTAVVTSPLPLWRFGFKPRVFESEACRQTYLRLFGGAKTADFRIFFGYKDARPARFVGDRYEKEVLLQKLTDPCQRDDQACGFDLEKSGVLFKTISGPDGAALEIRLQVYQSSAGPDDEDNRKNPYQQWLSDSTERIFLQSLREADVVFYNGHSRAGGGPDFHPPLLHNIRTGVLDYRYYQKKTPGLKRMLEALQKTDGRLKVLGLFSCASSRHFEERLLEARPIGLITSAELIYFSDALELSLASLDVLLKMKCQPDFDRELNSRSPQAGTQRIGIF